MRFFFFGDSICFGQHVSPHRTWVVRTAAALHDRFGDGVAVANPSINGNTTRMALERMAFDVLSHEPDLLYVQFGLNDCNHWATDRGVPRVSPEAFAANLKEIIDRAIAFGVRRVLLGTNHPTPRTEPFAHAPHLRYEDGNRRYNAIIRAVAEGADRAFLVDHEAAWGEALDRGGRLSDLLLADGIHLSVEGHDLYLRTALPEAQRAVERLL